MEFTSGFTRSSDVQADEIAFNTELSLTFAISAGCSSHDHDGRDSTNIQSRMNRNTCIVLAMTITYGSRLRIVIVRDDHMIFPGQYLNIDLNSEY